MDVPSGYDTDFVVRLETNLDDLSPEISGVVMEKLLAAGSLDVWFTPVHMKKNRPGVMLSVLSDEANLQALADIILTETSAFGLRVEKVMRLKLNRRFETVETEHGKITVKLGLRAGNVVQVAPEFESCKKVSTEAGIPIRAVYEAALRAWHSQNSENLR